MKTITLSLALILAAAVEPQPRPILSTRYSTSTVSAGLRELVWPPPPDKPRIRFVRTSER